MTNVFYTIWRETSLTALLYTKQRCSTPSQTNGKIAEPKQTKSQAETKRNIEPSTVRARVIASSTLIYERCFINMPPCGFAWWEPNWTSPRSMQLCSGNVEQRSENSAQPNRDKRSAISELMAMRGRHRNC